VYLLERKPSCAHDHVCVCRWGGGSGCAVTLCVRTCVLLDVAVCEEGGGS